MSVMPQLAILHFLTCGHWPPLMAEAREASQAESNWALAFFPRPLPFVIALTVLAKSTSKVVSDALVSLVGGGQPWGGPKECAQASTA